MGQKVVANSVSKVDAFIYPHVLADTTTHENGMMPPPVSDGFGPEPSAAGGSAVDNLRRT